MSGRNEPCPCGSGRKYKHCCLIAKDAADFRWRQIRAAEARLVPELVELGLTQCGPRLVEAALDEFFLWAGVPLDYEQSDEFTQFFVPWLVYEFVADPQDPDRVVNAPREPLAALYLRRRGAQLSTVERALLESACANPFSYHAVTRVVPGSEIALRDVLTGAEVTVRERGASGTLQPGALLFARVVTVDETSIMSGCAPLAIPPAWHLPILDQRARFAGSKGRMLTREALHEFDMELREFYFQIEDEVCNPTFPELRNTDGDRLVLTMLTYRLGCSPAEAFERLKSLSRLSAAEAGDLLSAATLDERGALKAVTIPWTKRANRQHQVLDPTTLGTLEIDGDRLQVEVNSTRRARRIEREIEKRLGADAVQETRTAEPIEKLLAERRASPRDALAELEQERLQQLPEVQELLREQGARHWEAWLDMQLPALGNRTPRQAARSREGRERLEALFAEFAWSGHGKADPMAPDVPALRAKLGLR